MPHQRAAFLTLPGTAGCQPALKKLLPSWGSAFPGN